jgi:hypothetical protein
LDEGSYEYFERHIIRGLGDDDAKPARFEGERNIVRDICKEIFEDDNTFIDNSKKLAQYLYKCMANDEKEVSGDLAVIRFESEKGTFIALLKLNFSNVYSHMLKNDGGKLNVNVGVSKTGLPNINQKVSKCAFIRPSKDATDYELLICDKELEGYFVQAFLKCSLYKDSREKTKVIRHNSELFARKVFRDNAQEAESFRKKVTEELQNGESFDIDRIVEESLPTPALRQEYKACLASEGITENKVTLDREWAEKKLKRKRLKVDKEIELYIDSDAYNNKDKFQIKRNGDGTIDIVLKNIKNYIEK